MAAAIRLIPGCTLLLCLAACEDQQTPADVRDISKLVAAETTSSTTVQYVCEDGSRVQSRYEQRLDRMVLFMSDRAVRLEPVRSADGTRFEADGIVFRTQGDEARLERDGQPAVRCRQSDQADT